MGDPAFDEGQQQGRGFGHGVGREAGGVGLAQDLLELGLDAIVNLRHALAQAFGLADQRIAELKKVSGTNNWSLCFITTNPVVWFPVLMSYRDDKNTIFFHGVHQFIWKLVKEALPYITTLYGPRLGIRGNS